MKLSILLLSLLAVVSATVRNEELESFDKTSELASNENDFLTETGTMDNHRKLEDLPDDFFEEDRTERRRERRSDRREDIRDTVDDFEDLFVDENIADRIDDA
mmetsp:Transcript_10271/g.19252  ORF Transcript_10271/g.19252 Transcript_10271/m.19252 type:complete len:103 (+) Transcript_10271:607-915(+)